jgi:hypothetical protein
MKLPYIALLIIIASGCSSVNTAVSPSFQSAGKKILIRDFLLTQQKKRSKQNTDSIYISTGQAIARSIIPYLQQKGFIVYTSTPVDSSSNTSLPGDIDYTLVGSGSVNVVGSSTFVEQFSLELKNNQTQQTLAVANFSGVSIRAQRAGEKLGKAIIKKM